MSLPAILVIYHHPLSQNAPTIMDHVHSFRKYSKWPVWEANIIFGLPKAIRDIQFSCVILHYSLFGSGFGLLDQEWLDYIGKQTGYKVAFFQDEFQHIPDRLAFCRKFNLNRIYSLYEPQYFGVVYQEFAPKVRPTLAGYVSDTMLAKAYQFIKPVSDRKIDVGYRTRRQIPSRGVGAMEKHEIGERFLLQSKGLQTDIMVCEEGRLYGDDWWRFLAECKFCLGTESGVSLTDLNNEAWDEFQQTGAVSKVTLERLDNKIPFRMLSPRIFEAAAFKICQILYEGHYNGIIKPWEHYIPLKKDFSNILQVRGIMEDEVFCDGIRERAYKDLISSRNYTYELFARCFDGDVAAAFNGKRPEMKKLAEAMFDTDQGLCKITHVITQKLR